MRLPGRGIHLSKATTALPLFALLAILACTSSSSETATPPPNEGPTPTPDRVVVRTQSPDDPTPTAISAIPSETDTPTGVVGPGRNPGPSGESGFVGLPSHCALLSNESERFIENSINADHISFVGLVAENVSGEEGIQFIATQLAGLPQSLSADENAIAVWGTFRTGNELLTYDNTWPANRLAAEYSNFVGSGGSSDFYSQLPGFAAAVECAEAAADSIFVAVEPTDPDAQPPMFTFNSQRCVNPDLPTRNRITGALLTSEFEDLELGGQILLQPEEFGGGDVLWHYGAVVAGGPVDETPGEDGPLAIWIKVVQRDGTSQYYARNELATEISDLSYPPFGDVPPSSPEDIAHLEECVRGERLVETRPTQGPSVFTRRISVSSCLRPDDTSIRRLAQYLKQDAFVTNLSAIVVETLDNGESIGDQLVFLAGNTGGANPQAQRATAVWAINDFTTFTGGAYIVVSMNDEAQEASLLKALNVSEINAQTTEYINSAIECSEERGGSNLGITVVSDRPALDESRCVIPNESIVAILQDSLVNEELVLLNSRAVLTEFPMFSRLGDVYFVAAEMHGPELEEPLVWVWISEDFEDPDSRNFFTLSDQARIFSDLTENGGAEASLASVDGFLEVKACVAAAEDEGEQDPEPTIISVESTVQSDTSASTPVPTP